MPAHLRQVATRPVALMRAAGLKPFVDFLARAGARVERILRPTGLSTSVLGHPEGLIPIVQAFRFMDESARTQRHENLGLLVGRETAIDALGIFGGLIARASTLRDAIEAAIRMMPAFSSGDRFSLVSQGDRARLCHAFGDGVGAASEQADQYWLILTINLVGLAAGPRWRPDEVGLETQRTAGFGDIDVLSAATISFDQPETSVTFPAAMLDRPLRQGPGALRTHDEDIAAWKASAPGEDFPRSVLQVIQTLVSPEYPRIGLTADAIGMSVRVLQRRLARAGLSYERLIAEARFGTAVHLLEGTDATVLDIALDLGYSDAAHFTRAFRRWTGVAPREFRRLRRRASAGRANVLGRISGRSG